MTAPSLDPADALFFRELEDLLVPIILAMDGWENIPSRKEQEAIVGRTRRAVSSRPELGSRAAQPHNFLAGELHATATGLW